MARMPTIDEVLAYAQPICRKFIMQNAGDAPAEHHDEIFQTLAVRLIEAYPTIDPDAGWRSFVYNHARGTVLDYLKFGKGFEETNWSLQNYKEGNTPKLTKRVENRISEDPEDAFDLDQTLGNNGIFNELKVDRIDIKWELLARLSSIDENLHAFVKYLRGISVEDMAPVFGLCRTRVSQMIQVFIDRFDDPDMADNPWFKQICFALGICSNLGMADIDQSTVMNCRMGWELNPVDLDSVKPHHYLLELDAQTEMKLDDQEAPEAQEG